MSITTEELRTAFIPTEGVNANPRLRLHLVGGDIEDVPSWMKDLRENGWTVIPQAIPRENADHYADEAYKWLESWDLGYKRDDPSTRKMGNMPWSVRGGLYARYGIGHEQFVWDLKQEPGIVEKFEKIWATNELVASFDGVNISLPLLDRPKTDVVLKPWPHVDQTPLRTNLHCVQGIMNLLPNGPEDGGLMVLAGSSHHYEELFKHFDHKKPEEGWNTWDQQNVDEEMTKWLIEEKGCKWVKICAQPGDLLLWDSRTIHYGAQPTSTNDRIAVYVCYKPEKFMTDDARELRRQCWEGKMDTTHDPVSFRTKPRLPPADHPTYEKASRLPLQEPKLTARGRQLVGLDSY